MFSTLREEVMRQPVADRLEYALNIIDELSASSSEEVAWAMKNLSLTKAQAKMVIALSKSFPRALSKEQVMTAIYGPFWEVDDKVLSVYAFHIRRKHPDLIVTHWGFGFSVSSPIDLGASSAPVRAKLHSPWSEQDDADLIQMLDTGSDISVIADELERSERSVLDRIRHLKRAR